jgi:hypothetical protein
MVNHYQIRGFNYKKNIGVHLQKTMTISIHGFYNLFYF